MRCTSAVLILLVVAAGVGVWLVAPGEWRFVPHPIYFTWIVSLVTFFAVASVDRRRIDLAR